MKTKLKQKPDTALWGTILFLTLIGLSIRLAPALQSTFPLNDGGLFYAMIVELQAAHFSLPAFAHYNGATIPFAYPPFSFYLSGLLASGLHVSLLDVLRLLPPIVSGLTIPAFALLSKEMTDSKVLAVFATFAFAFLPRDFSWLIMGGGITRSFGLLFALLTMRSVYLVFTRYQPRHFWTSILFGTLTILSHPEATVHTALSALVFYLWKDRSLKGLLRSLGIAAGTLALSSPWWGTVIAQHGLAPFQASMIAASQDSYNPLVGLFIFFHFLFADEPFLPILTGLGLIGLFASLARKQSFWAAWMFILHLVEPRGGALYMMLPLALLIGYGMENVILPALRPVGETPIPPQELKPALEQILQAKVARYLLIFLFAYSAMSAYHTSLKIQQSLSLQSTDLQAFNWVRENTPPSSNFVLITRELPLIDAWSEWFPALTGRISQGTVFGYEWVKDGKFGQRVDAYKDLQACASQDAFCLDAWAQRHKKSISYVLIQQPGAEALLASLKSGEKYKMIYKVSELAIFRK